MFDEETTKMVEDGKESFVYELFGYEGCCKPGTNFYPRTGTASPEEGIEDSHAATATIETLPLPIKLSPVLTVICLVALPIFGLLPISRFLWKPRRGAIANHNQQEMN
jgi:hypothetical protein